MYEKVNPCHPDKIADRIAGALVDLAYRKSSDPKIAVEVLIGHEQCTVLIESSEEFTAKEINDIVARIAGPHALFYKVVPQDYYLADNQEGAHRCGDNGIFKGSPITEEQNHLAVWARMIYSQYPSDGKYLIANGKMTVCQSHVYETALKELCPEADVINPLGYWTGGLRVDSGATNRKLGSDMGDAVTGGGIHGKDLTKADVTINIYLHLLAQQLGIPVFASCSIGDEQFTVYDEANVPVREVGFQDAIYVVRKYIDNLGGFEKLAEWGLI